MPELGAGQSEVELDAKQGRLRVTGQNLLAVLTTIGVVLMAYALYMHIADGTELKQLMVESRKEYVQAVREMTTAQNDGVRQQRVMNCLISTDQKDRQSMLATCERISR